jgi:hypothetical protein
METRRWTNPSQPQTLQIAVFLLYANAVLGLVFGNAYFRFGGLFGLAAMVAFAAGGFGIANEKRWGYTMAVVVSAGEVLCLILIFGPIGLLGSQNLLGFAFAVALAALLLHPQSRDYQRIWFS